ncbi:hypothetical protein [Streptomyces sp. NPDC058426]|uniref:hypothetical protein n=1 Tax=Streptomyces sp. NPDC058426 TaxID=3346493 RepID=UPI003655FCA3
MSPISRPPEWQQDADRHAHLVDPVLTVRQIGRFEFRSGTHSRIDHALVFATSQGEYASYLPPLRPTRGEAARRRFSAVYEVDMGIHPFRTQLRLPSANDAFEFGAELDLTWQVTDPAAFVRGGHRDVPDLLTGELQRLARPVTRRFAVDESAAAEMELFGALRTAGGLGEAAGLRTTWTLRIRRDEGAIEHQHRMRAIEHGAAQQIHATEQGTAIDRAYYAQQAQRSHLELLNQAERERQYQEYALETQRHQHELILQRAKFEIEQQEVLRQKIDFYAYYLERGGPTALALQLAERPDDIQQVVMNMREDQARALQTEMDAVRQVLEAGGAEDHHLEAARTYAVRVIESTLSQRYPDGPPAALPHPRGSGEPATSLAKPGTAPAPTTTGTGPDSEPEPADSPTDGVGSVHPPTAPSDASPTNTVYVPPAPPAYTPPAAPSYAPPPPPASPPPPPYAPLLAPLDNWQPPAGYGMSPVPGTPRIPDRPEETARAERDPAQGDDATEGEER